MKPRLIDLLEQVSNVDLSDLDLTQVDINALNDSGENALMYYFEHKERYDLFFNEAQLQYLIDNSNLEQRSNRLVNALLLMLKNKAKQNLNLTTSHIDSIIKKSTIAYKKEETLDQALIYDFRFPHDLCIEHWQKIMKCCLGEVFEEDFMKKFCALLCVTNNFGKIFPAIEDKKSFISYLHANQKKFDSFDKIYHSDIIQLYIEKEQLESLVPDANNTGGVTKI